MQARPARRTMAARAVGETQMIAAGRLVTLTREMPPAAATRTRSPSPTHSTRTTMPPSTSLPPLSQRSSRSATGAARQTANKATTSQRRARADTRRRYHTGTIARRAHVVRPLLAGSRGGLEQFDRVAVGVQELDLPAAGSVDDFVSKRQSFRFQRLHQDRQVLYP